MATLVVVSTPRPGGDEALRSYVEQVMPLLIGAGGQVIKRVGVTDVVSGATSLGMVFVMDFQEAEPVRAFFKSAEYAALMPVRDQTSSRWIS